MAFNIYALEDNFHFTYLFPSLSFAEEIEDSKAIYKLHCCPCHGITGEGNGPKATELKIKPQDHTNASYMSTRTDNQLENVIRNGGISISKFPYGLYDMSGNVWEWIDDYYYAHPGSDYVNPEFGAKYRMLKGGSYWDCSAYGCGISAPAYNRAFFEQELKVKLMGSGARKISKNLTR